MGYYSEVLPLVKQSLRDKEKYEKKVNDTWEQIKKSQGELLDLINAQKLIATVSDDNTTNTLDFITGVINKALSEIFKGDIRKIFLEKKLYADSKPHIVLNLVDGHGNQLDLAVQSGTGLGQIVSVLFIICLIEIRKGRRLVILDEKLSGLHREAKRILSEIIKIFAEGGFQFIFVEYNLNDIGKIYNVEKLSDTSKVYSLNGEKYSDDQVFIFSEADLSLLEDGVVDEDF